MYVRFDELKVNVNKPYTLLGLFISLIGFMLIAEAFYYVYYHLGGAHVSWSTLIYTVAQLIGFAILTYVLKKERQSFSTVWFGEGGLRDFAYAMAFLVLAWIAWGLLGAIASALGIPEYKWWERWNVATPLDVLPMAIFSLSAAFFEEVFYRGYAITRLYSLTNNMPLSAIISIVFFTALHYVFGLKVMICILGWGTIDTLLFLYRKSTKASFYYHFVNNATVYVLFPLLGMLR